MSTVLWANVLIDGAVLSDESDHSALYHHAEKLDALAKTLALPSLLAIVDTTDLRFNVEDVELPPGLESTNEMMATSGAWMPIADAIALLSALRDHVVARQVRFGLLRNQHAEIVAELDEVLAFAREQSPKAQRFNFSVVM